MTKRTFAVLAGMMLVASLAVAGCSASEEVTVDDIIVDEVTEEVTTDMMEEDMMEEELTKAQIKKRDKRAEKIMPSTEEQYGKKRGKEIAYAIATDQVTEET